MSKTTIFLASSTAAKAQARALAHALSSESLTFLPWWEAFTPGRTILQEIEGIRQRVQGAVLLLSPEAPATVRGKQIEIPNLNVLFEFGYFYGALQKERVAIIKYGEFYLPSDLEGYIHIFGSKAFRRGRSSPISKRTASEFSRWVTSANFAAGTSNAVPPVAASTQVQHEPRKRRTISLGINNAHWMAR